MSYLILEKVLHGLIFMLPLSSSFLCSSPYRNVTEFDGQDACGSNSWAIADVDPPPRPTEGKKADDPRHLIKSLKPWTQYAIMVKTQLSSSDEHQVHGAKSKIIYIRTNASSESRCCLRLFSNSSQCYLQRLDHFSTVLWTVKMASVFS